MKQKYNIPKEFYDWVLDNHPDPDAIFKAEFECYQIWQACQIELQNIFKELTINQTKNES